jgi:hypothetical protein
MFSAPPETESIRSVTLTFLRGSFTPESSVSFGIDRDVIGDGAGNAADTLEGGVVFASTTKNDLRGVFVNNYGFGFSFLDGFGLIDAVQAARQIP